MPQRNKLVLTSPIPPSVNHYLVPKAGLRNGRPFVYMYETAEAKEYKRSFSLYIQTEALKQDWNTDWDKKQHFYMDCFFYFDRIDKDPNNYFKLLCDAITESGMVWIDDNVACERVQGIWYDSNNPRIEMIISPVEYVGIFKDSAAHAEFVEKCEICKRYPRNCSILRDSEIGRVNAGVVNKICQKYKE